MSLPVERISVDFPPDPDIDPAAWPFTLAPIVAVATAGLDLGAITVLVGENGSGKSTLLEGLAMAYGLSTEGGSTGARHSTRSSESPLFRTLRLRRGIGASRWGFFLRAETMHGYYTYLEDHPGRSREPLFDELSHGESFIEVLTSRFQDPGLYLLDEPESALSFTGCLALVGLLHRICSSGNAQAVVSTHSPVVAAIPGAHSRGGRLETARIHLGRPGPRAELARIPRRAAAVPAPSDRYRHMSAASLPPGYPAAAPIVAGRVISAQQWASVAFVHWPVRAESVARFFPRGTRPDVFGDGYTYVGLVPFAMHRAGFGPGFPVPYFGTFLETNVRLYSVDDEGRHGVLFRSLDTSRLAVVPVTRAVLGIRYCWSKMRLTRDGDVIRYDSTRRLPHRGLQSRLSLRIGAAVEPTALEVFLTARWGAHTRVAGRTLWVPNEHPPWSLHVAEVLDLRDELVAASGAVPAGPRLRALWSPLVRTRFGRPMVLS